MKFSVFPRRVFFSDTLLRHGSVMFVATTLGGALNYLYQVYMGRALGPEDYSVFGALFAIFYMMVVVSTTLSTSATRFVSLFIGEGKEIGFFLRGSLRRMAVLGLAVSLLFLIFTKPIASFLKLPGIEPLLVLALVLFFVWLVPINSGALRGLQRFHALGFMQISNAFFKLIFGIFFVALGFGVTGALLGAAFGMLLAFLISFSFLTPYFKPNNPHEPSFNFSTFYAYSLPVMLAMFFYSIPANLDVVLAKYFFSAREAGLYTSASVLGKVIFFFPAAIHMVMFPMIAEQHARGRETMSLLKRSLAYTALLSGSVVLAYLLFPQLILLLFGSNYASALPLVAPYSFAMLFFSLTVIILNYHLAIKNLTYVALFASLTFLEVLLFLIFHSSILEMAKVLLFSNLALFAASFYYTWRWLR